MLSKSLIINIKYDQLFSILIHLDILSCIKGNFFEAFILNVKNFKENSGFYFQKLSIKHIEVFPCADILEKRPNQKCVILYIDQYKIKIMSESIKSVLSSTGIHSEQYKKYMNDIIKSIQNLDSFTDGMQQKVDGILKAQQKQFVNAYRQHMMKIKEDFKKLEYQLQAKDAKIADYENEGRMSTLLKRINFLEIQQKRMLQTLAKKNAEIRESHLEKKILKSQIKNLEEKVKGLLRAKTQIQEKMSHNAQTHHGSIPTFSTEVYIEKSERGSMQKLITRQRSQKVKMRSMRQKSLLSEMTLNPQSSNQMIKLQRENKILRKQNRELVMYNSKSLQETVGMQNFFIEVVNQIKKNIAVRKKVKDCSLEDFRKEDKLELLIRVLSNDEILVYLYEKIFGKKVKNNINEISQELVSSKRKINALRLAKPSFPAVLQRQSLLHKSHFS